MFIRRIFSRGTFGVRHYLLNVISPRKQTRQLYIYEFTI